MGCEDNEFQLTVNINGEGPDAQDDFALGWDEGYDLGYSDGFAAGSRAACDDTREEEEIDGADIADRLSLGAKGEAAACRYLERMGFQVIERNWRCKFGEVDVIARDEDGTLCFIEVKTRRGVEDGVPEQAVTPAKRRKYEKIAMCYMGFCKDIDEVPVRFDAIGICVNDGNRAMLRHHKGFFDVWC